MHVVIERKDLHGALSAVGRVVEGRNTIPILSNALLAAAGESLTVEGTDLDMVAIRAARAEVRVPGRLTVPARLLEDIARKLPDGAQITLKAADDGTRLAVTSGRSRFTLNALPAEDWPTFPAPDMSEIEIDPRALAGVLAGERDAISDEETRYYLNGIYAHAREGDLTLVATDGHRLAKRVLDGIVAGVSVIWPRKAVDVLAAMLARHEKTPGAKLVYGVCAQRVRFSIAGEVLESKVIDGTFPDYTRVIPQAPPRHATLDRRALAAALDRVTTVRGERGSAVRLEFEGDELSLTVNSADNGSAEDMVKTADFEGAPVVVGVNGGYLAELLAALDADTVQVHLGEPGSPLLWTVPTAQDRLMVLMPMRV